MPRGGARAGAGRPRGQGRFKEPTKPVRVPEGMLDQVLGFVETNGFRLPLYTCAVQAGFPSPADDHMEGDLDLNEHLIKHPAATFLVRATGDSMTGAGIHSGDILVVDRSLDATHGRIVIAAVDGLLTVKRLDKSSRGTFLVPDNDDFKPIQIDEDSSVVIWGVVTYVLHSL